jgi:hypothetical protein
MAPTIAIARAASAADQRIACRSWPMEASIHWSSRPCGGRDRRTLSRTSFQGPPFQQIGDSLANGRQESGDQSFGIRPEQLAKNAEFGFHLRHRPPRTAEARMLGLSGCHFQEIPHSLDAFGLPGNAFRIFLRRSVVYVAPECDHLVHDIDVDLTGRRLGVAD